MFATSFHIPESAGEIRAHDDMCKKYDVKCSRKEKGVFIVTSLSSS